MIVETQLDFKKYLRLMYTLTYRKPMMIFLTIVGLTMFIMAILYFLGNHALFDSPPLFQIVFGFILVGIFPLSVYRSSKKGFSSNGRLQEKITYEFTDEKITHTGETFNSEMDWSKIYKVEETKDWILIYQNNLVANLLPKESFGDNLPEFRRLVRSKGIKAKLKR